MLGHTVAPAQRLVPSGWKLFDDDHPEVVVRYLERTLAYLDESLRIGDPIPGFVEGSRRHTIRFLLELLQAPYRAFVCRDRGIERFAFLALLAGKAGEAPTP